MNNESEVYSCVRRALSGTMVPYIHFGRIENTVGVGIPDLFLTAAGRTAWIELKFNRRVLRPEQYVWIRDQIRAGGCVLLIEGTPDRIINIWRMNDITPQHVVFHEEKRGWRVECPPMISCSTGQCQVHDAIMRLVKA